MTAIEGSFILFLYRPYTFLQLIREDRINTASDDVEFWVKPGDVKDIRADAFADLPKHVREILENATLTRLAPEDDDLLGLSGEDLYKALGPLRKACFLNIVTKAAHDDTTGDCLDDIGGLLLCRQDRFFPKVAAGLPQTLRKSPLFKSAPGALHPPLPGYTMTGDSFKSRDAHANLQVTFMREDATGDLAADIDIDESSGIEHGFEVIKNATFKSKTNPYLIREFMLSADRANLSLDPGIGSSSRVGSSAPDRSDASSTSLASPMGSLAWGSGPFRTSGWPRPSAGPRSGS